MNFNLFVIRFAAAFNGAAAGWYATMAKPVWLLAGVHGAASLACLYGLWDLARLDKQIEKEK